MQFFDFSLESFITTLMKILALLIAIIGHEIMHGLSAFLFGDRSAKDANRLSLNPIRHLDMMGSVLLPGFITHFSSPFFVWVGQTRACGYALYCLSKRLSSMRSGEFSRGGL